MDNEVTAQGALTSDQRNMGLLIWIGSIFFGLLPPLILFFARKDDPYVLDQAKEGLNLGITMFIGMFISGILAVVLIGFVLMFVLIIANLVFCIMGAVAASKGQSGFRVPFALRLIK